MTTVYLFDIDQTLLRSDGVARAAMERVFYALYDRPRAFDGIDFAGRTDRAILRDAYARYLPHLAGDPAEIARFRDRYVAELATALRDTRVTVLPGVPALLDALEQRPDVVLGLGTGNFRATARLKLGAAGLDGRFVDGGFADDAEERAAVIAAGAQRLLRRIAGRATVWVVGDSPHDIAAARANGLYVAAVATGSFSPATLAELRPDALFTDLADTKAFLRATLGA
jgi:phosphoglycolate phosphatase